jgi:hypothetical protein
MIQPYVQHPGNTRKIIADEFHVPIEELPPDRNFLFTAWEFDPFNSKMRAIFYLNGKLYEVAAEHCSCNGYKGQWQPREVTSAALAMRLVDHTYEGVVSEPDCPLGYGWLDHEHHARFREFIEALCNIEREGQTVH